MTKDGLRNRPAGLQHLENKVVVVTATENTDSTSRNRAGEEVVC